MVRVGFRVDNALVGGACFVLALATAVALTAALQSQAGLETPAPASLASLSERGAAEAYAELPVSFVPNAGQMEGPASYYTLGAGFSFYFTKSKVTLSFEKGGRRQVLEMRFLGASRGTRLVPGRPAEGKVNYIQGSDRRRWQTGLSTYRRLTYRDLWPGIDMVFLGERGRLRYDFVVHAGARASDIRLAYAGAKQLSVSEPGHLRIRTELGTLTDREPVSFQRIAGRKAPVDSRFVLHPEEGKGVFGIAVGGYDRRQPLVIDPALLYSTYLGGSFGEFGYGIAVDGGGNAYVTGRVDGSGYPTTAGVFDASHNGGMDVFVTKLNATGTALSYSTYLGGSGNEDLWTVAVDGAGNAYVAGPTTSSNFPTTSGAYQTTCSSCASSHQDVYVTKLNSSGSNLVYSTFLGGTGSDHALGIDVDGSGNAYVNGYTSSNPFATSGGGYDTTFNGDHDAFVAKLNGSGSGLTYWTYLGGSALERGLYGIAVDGAGAAYVSGETLSTDFPTTAGVIQSTCGSCTGPFDRGDAYVTKLNAAGSSLVYSTYLGGSLAEWANDVAIDSSGNAYVSGPTMSSNFPTTAGAFQTAMSIGTGPMCAGGCDAFVSRLNSTASGLVYSTYLGGNGDDLANGVAVDTAGNAYVTGQTHSSDFPTTPDAVDATYNPGGNGWEGFVTKLNAAGSAPIDSTYLGGSNGDYTYAIAVDEVGSAYVAGQVLSSDFPTTPAAPQTSIGGGSDAFATKIVYPDTYPRPASGTPLRVPLVPLYEECDPGTANNQHSAPIDEPSCYPPALESELLTTSTVGRGAASLRLDVFCNGGLPGDTPPCNLTPGNPEDISIAFSATDVLCTSGGNPGCASPGDDYSGQVILTLPLRLTDEANGPSATVPSTVADFDFELPATCAAQAGVVGATCSATTTVNTLVPGSVKAKKRMVISVLGVKVLDAGADGSVTPGSGTCPPTCGNGDESTYLNQGVFAP